MSEQEIKVTFGITIPKSLKIRLKTYCAQHDLKMQDVIKGAIEEYLSKRGA